MAGTYSETLLAPGATQLSTDSSSFAATISGSSVTLTFSHGFGSTISGELAGNTLSLSIPLTDGSIQVETYHPGTTADYNAEVQLVQSSAAQLQAQAASISASSAAAQQQQAAQQQLDQTVSDASSALQQMLSSIPDYTGPVTSDLQSATSALSDQSRALGQLKTAVATVESDIKTRGKGDSQTCGDYAAVQADIDVVNSDQNSVQGALGSTSYQSLQTTSTQITEQQQTLDTAVSADPNFTPQVGITPAADVKAGLATLSGALDTWTKVSNGDLASAKATTQQAQSIVDKVTTASGC